MNVKNASFKFFESMFYNEEKAFSMFVSPQEYTGHVTEQH